MSKEEENICLADSLLKKEVSRIILARPAVEAGEKLGFLPGDLYAKVNPYLRPLYDALFDMMDMERATRAIERGDIEIAPLGYMRGRTLNVSMALAMLGLEIFRSASITSTSW